jgi:hypothetical protein
MKTKLIQLLDEYNLSNYEPRMFGTPTSGGSISLGKTRGNEFPIYTPLDEPTFEDEDDCDDEFPEEDLNLSNIDSAQPRARVDIGNRYDVGNFVTNRGIKETVHTNKVPQGIATGLSYRKPSGGKNKGSSITGRSSSYPMFNPGNFKRTGTQFGTSRAPKPPPDEENENPIYSLDDILHPMELSFHRQQNRIKKILHEIKYIY